MRLAYLDKLFVASKWQIILCSNSDLLTSNPPFVSTTQIRYFSPLVLRCSQIYYFITEVFGGSRNPFIFGFSLAAEVRRIGFAVNVNTDEPVSQQFVPVAYHLTPHLRFLLYLRRDVWFSSAPRLLGDVTCKPPYHHSIKATHLLSLRLQLPTERFISSRTITRLRT